MLRSGALRIIQERDDYYSSIIHPFTERDVFWNACPSLIYENLERVVTARA